MIKENYSSGSVVWKSPSNIALIKYWGKYGDQLPSNPSLSLTLGHSYTQTQVSWTTIQDKGEKSFELNFQFEGHPNPSFESRIKKYMEKIQTPQASFQGYRFDIESFNTFPHSTGIASSASALSALALGLNTFFKESGQKNFKNDWDFLTQTSSLARRGSGSACRSLFGGVVSWGECQGFESTQEAASPVEGSHPVFSTLQDSILIVSQHQKTVSSSAGHELMNNHPFAKERFEQAKKNMAILGQSLKSGDLSTFIQIVEWEALCLHSLMMTSSPSYILMSAETLEIVHKVREFRNRHHYPVCFTIDAGPNVHLLYPQNIKDEVCEFIEVELGPYLQNMIHDEVGHGPQRC